MQVSLDKSKNKLCPFLLNTDIYCGLELTTMLTTRADNSPNPLTLTLTLYTLFLHVDAYHRVPMVAILSDHSNTRTHTPGRACFPQVLVLFSN